MNAARKIALAGLLTLGAASLSDSAFASDGCDFQTFNHNGSRMDYENCGGPLEIIYSRPRAAMKRQGVTSGTTLFRGQISRSGRISGTAYRFKAGCGRIGYRVSGSFRGEGPFTLTGEAPIRGSGCTVTRYKRDRLRFN